MSQGAAVQTYHPATFHERGACLPLTTPLLMGARVRATGRDGLELVVPKASGGRGDYVVPWRNIGDLCRPGVHDTRLLARVMTLRTITPATVREASWQAAQEGFAGRRARAAAQVAAAAAAEARSFTQYQLLVALVRQTNPDALPAGPVRPAQLEPLARQAVGRLALELNRSTEVIVGALVNLADMIAPLGLGERLGVARAPVMLVTIQALRQSVATLPAAAGWESEAVTLMTRTADLTLGCLTSTLAEVRGLAESVTELVKAWMADPVGMTAWIGRGEWLTDGWSWLCHLWALAGSAGARLRALDEIIPILPVLPREATNWVGFGPGSELPPRLAHRAVSEAHDSASLSDTVMRNEALLALAA